VTMLDTLTTTQAQNVGQERVVPHHVLHDLHAQMPTADQLHAEGFAAVHLASALAQPAGGAQ